MNLTIYQLGEQERALIDLLYENGGELTPEIEQALNDTQEGLVKKVDGYNKIIRELDYYSEACKAEAKRITENAKRAENAKNRLKSHILEAMRMFEWDKLEGDTVKVTRTKREAIEVDMDEVNANLDLDLKIAKMQLPDYVKVSATVDKTRVKQLYGNADVMPAGCKKVENEYILMK